MREALVQASYLLASVLFILSLKSLSRADTAARGVDLAVAGMAIAIVENGDPIVIDAVRKTIELGVSKDTIDRRLRAWQPPPKKAERGLLAKYARLVNSASQGAVTDAALG